MENMVVDVVVIGAGLSGLSSAFHLVQRESSLNVLVLEAKDRVGGRTKTVQMMSSDDQTDQWDVGGEWVGRPQTDLHNLLRTFNLETFIPSVSQTMANSKLDNSLSWYTRLDLQIFLFKLNRLKTKLKGRTTLQDYVPAHEWDKESFEDYVHRNVWTTGARNVTDAACRCLFGLAPSEMTLLYFLMYIDSAGGLQVFTQPDEYSGKDSRVKGGLQQLAFKMVDIIGQDKVLLDQPVTNIVQTSETVVVITSNRLQVSCNRLIVALPPHHTASIKFTPPLPSEQLNLLGSVPLAFLVKFAITYKQAFWVDDNCKFGFQRVLEDPELGSVGIVYDATSFDGHPALSGFLSSVGREQIDDEIHKHRVLTLIKSILGDPVDNFVEFTLKDWSKEPYNGGCFLKSLIPGTTSYFNQDLRKPHNRVHFAGTETATVWCGFMNGAVQAGFRAAEEVLSEFLPQKTPRNFHNNYDIDVAVKSISLAVFGAGLLSVGLIIYKTGFGTHSARHIPQYIQLLCV